MECLLRGMDWVFKCNLGYMRYMGLRTNSDYSLFNINWLVCITETESVYCAVRTGYLNVIWVICFIWIWEQTAIISLYSINRLVFITEKESVYCAVRTGYLNVIWVICFIWIWEQTAIISPYNINWLNFISETECVYCAVRTEFLHTLEVNLTS